MGSASFTHPTVADLLCYYGRPVMKDIMEKDVDTLAAWHALAQKLLVVGYEIAGASAPALKGNGDRKNDIRLLAVLLVARSLSNMRGMLTMIREQQIVEARTLARCIHENFFWMAGFAHDPKKFRQILIDDDIKRKSLQGQMLFEGGDLPDALKQKLRQWMRDNQGQAAKEATPRQLARDADVADAYLFYRMLSVDAHPTLHALYRHVIMEADQTISEIDLSPAPAGREQGETVGLGCFALVQVLGCACEILGADAAGRVDLLAREYLELMKVQADASG